MAVSVSVFFVFFSKPCGVKIVSPNNSGGLLKFDCIHEDEFQNQTGSRQLIYRVDLL